MLSRGPGAAAGGQGGAAALCNQLEPLVLEPLQLGLVPIADRRRARLQRRRRS
jgi:hypothetical protein